LFYKYNTPASMVGFAVKHEEILTKLADLLDKDLVVERKNEGTIWNCTM
jgi:hypothetical protein